jgi:hypothetical protein
VFRTLFFFFFTNIGHFDDQPHFLFHLLAYQHTYTRQLCQKGYNLGVESKLQVNQMKVRVRVRVRGDFPSYVRYVSQRLRDRGGNRPQHAAHACCKLQERLEWLSSRGVAIQSLCWHICSNNIDIQCSNQLGRCRGCGVRACSFRVVRCASECVLRVRWHVGRFVLCYAAK